MWPVRVIKKHISVRFRMWLGVEIGGILPW